MTNTYLHKLISTPENLSLEGERFAQYCKSWDKEKTFPQIWDDLDFSFFSLKTGHELFDAIKSMSDDYDAIIENTSSIKAPFFLYMLLWYNHYTFEQYLQILQKSPSDNSIFTPVILYMAIQNAENAENAEKKFEFLSEVLKERSDGFSLAFNYIQYILSKNISKAVKEPLNQMQVIESTLCNVLRASFKQEAKNDLSYESRNSIKSFRTFGILVDENQNESLLSFFTKCFFLCDEDNDVKDNEACLEEFRSIFVTKDRSFFTHDFQTYSKHIYIAHIFLAQAEPLKVWKDFYNFMSAARNRIAFCYFGDEQMDLRYHFKFMFVVSLRILDTMLYKYKGENNIFDFWKEFWREGVSYARRFSFAQEDFIIQYLSMLILFIYRIHLHESSQLCVNNIASTIVSLFREISNMPYAISISLKRLSDAGFQFENFIMDSNLENIKFFKSAFSATKGIIEEIRQETELMTFIDKCNQLLKGQVND